MSGPVDVLVPQSFAARGHAHWVVVAGDNPREKGIHDGAFGHYGVTVARVSFEHEYSHDHEYGAKMAADYADRLVACTDAMKGIHDPRAFIAAVVQMFTDVKSSLEMLERDGQGDSPVTGFLRAALIRAGDAP